MSNSAGKLPFLQAESKSWVRITDAVITLLGATAIGIVYFVLPLEFDVQLLHYSFWLGLCCTPVVAHMLYQPTNLNRLQRIAVLGLVLTAVLALMIAAVESSKNIG